MCKCDSKIQALWNEIKEKGPSNEDLCETITWAHPLRDEAGNLLLKQQPSNEDWLILGFKELPRLVQERVTTHVRVFLHYEQTGKTQDTWVTFVDKFLDGAEARNAEATKTLQWY